MTRVKTKYAELLNTLDEMQQSHAYAVRRHVLSEAESTIVQLERETQAQREEIARLREALRTIANSEYQDRENHQSDYLWRWCRSEDTARAALAKEATRDEVE